MNADELLLACLRIEPDETDAARLRNLPAEDWQAIIRLSARCKVAPLLYHRLRGPDLPADVAQELRLLYLANAAGNMRLYHGLGELLRALRSDNIPVIVLKGAHLAEIVYGNPALRVMCDVDILVRKADLSEVARKMGELGYSQPELLGAGRVTTDCHLPTFSRPRAASVDVHWTVEPPPFSVDVDGLWERARPAKIAGCDVLALSSEDLLLHLCLHASAHHFFLGGLSYLCDLSEITRRYRGGIDWEQVVLRARQWRADRCAYLALRLAREWLRAAVPGEALDALRPGDFEPGILAVAGEQIFSDQGEASPPAPNIARLWNSGNLWDKAVLFLKRAFLPPKEMARLYPAPPDSARIYLYYPLRIRELLLRHGDTAWRLLRGDEVTATLADRGNALRDWLTPD